MLVCTVAVSHVYAALEARIASAEYNETKVIFDGEEMDLGGRRLVSVINEGETNIMNYMPVRAILENMGYGVSWDGSVLLFTEDYLSASEEWINLDLVLETIDNPDMLFARIYFLAERNTARVHVDARYNWDIQTAVVGGEAYIARSDANDFFELNGMPPL